MEKQASQLDGMEVVMRLLLEKKANYFNQLTNKIIRQLKELGFEVDKSLLI
jgi:hypothetical protein